MYYPLESGEKARDTSSSHSVLHDPWIVRWVKGPGRSLSGTAGAYGARDRDGYSLTRMHSSGFISTTLRGLPARSRGTIE